MRLEIFFCFCFPRRRIEQKGAGEKLAPEGEPFSPAPFYSIPAPPVLLGIGSNGEAIDSDMRGGLVRP